MAAKSSNLQNQNAYSRPSGAVHFARMFFMWLLVLACLFAVLYFAIMPKLTEQAASITYERMAVEQNAKESGAFIQKPDVTPLPSETEARWQLAIHNQVDGVLGKVEARLSEHYILLLVVTGITVTLILALFSFMQATREDKSEHELRQIRRNILEDWGVVRQELDVVKSEHDRAWRDQDTARLELEKIRLTLESSLTELDRTKRDLDQSRKDLDNSKKVMQSFRREQDSAQDNLKRLQAELDEHDKRARQELEDLIAQARTAMQNLVGYAQSADPGDFKPPESAESIFTSGPDIGQGAVQEVAAEPLRQAQQARQGPIAEEVNDNAALGLQFSIEDYRAMDHATLESWAETGDSMAVAELGYRYFMGIGVPVDHTTSVEYSRRAAEMGNATAQVDLGFMYMQGLGVPQDNQKAFEYYQKAADQRHDLGELNLGLLYVRGQGVRQDFVKAFDMFSRAARQGNVLGMLNLGVMYEQGDGVPRNFAKAIKLYNMAAEHGNVKAMMYLAEIYDVGNGTAMDPAQAMHWFTMAANTGNTDAMLKVARRYMSGTGVQPNNLTAYTYLLLYYAFESSSGEASKVSALMEKFGAVLSQEEIAAAQAEAARLWTGIHGQNQQQSGGARMS
jgi:TPR repeat protein